MPSSPSSPSASRGLRAVQESSAYATLAREAAGLDALDRALRQTLPNPLREQVHFARARDGRLVFTASSPVWASRLRMQQASLLATARALGVDARSLGVRVALPPPAPPAPPPPKTLSAAAVAHLRAAARATADPELRRLFLTLAGESRGD